MYYVKASLISLCILRDKLFISFHLFLSAILGLQVDVAEKTLFFYYCDGIILYIIYTFIGKNLFSLFCLLFFSRLKITLLVKQLNGEGKKGTEKEI